MSVAPYDWIHCEASTRTAPGSPYWSHTAQATSASHAAQCRIEATNWGVDRLSPPRRLCIAYRGGELDRKMGGTWGIRGFFPSCIGQTPGFLRTHSCSREEAAIVDGNIPSCGRYLPAANAA